MLNLYYRNEVCEYGALVERYEVEKRTSRLEQFPPLSDWSPSSGCTLTSLEQSLLPGPKEQTQKCSTLMTYHMCGRKIKYSSKESDKSTAGFSSSYVCTKNIESEKVIFGQIEFLFKHPFGGTLSRLAYVHWFSDHVVDRESGLVWINLNSCSSKNPITSLKILSPPLIHAADESDVNKVWILNYHVSLLC